MPDPARFEKTYELLQADDAMGVVYGWGAIFTKNGEEYFDTQGDSICPEAMERAALEFSQAGAMAGEMHEREAGSVPFLMPISKASAAAFGITTDVTGLAIGMKPTAEVYEKFRSGEYTGFSIGGTRVEETVIEKFAKAEDTKPGKYQQGKRRRMTKFKLDEISAVDRPAQVGARAVLMKRRADGDEISKRAMLTSNARGHAHLISLDDEIGSGRSSGFTSYEDGHAHPWVLQADGSYVIGMAQGHTHDEGEISTDETAASQILARKRESETMPETTATDLTKMEARLQRAEKRAELTDAHRAHFGKLAGEAAQDAFLALTPEARQAVIDGEVKKSEDADPVVATLEDGTQIRKSAGPVVIALANQSARDRAEIVKLRGATLDQNLAKRATEELGNLPGTPATKVAILKSLEALTPEERAAAMQVISAGDKAMKAAFNSRGYGRSAEISDSTENPSAEGAIAKRAAEIMKANPKLTKEAARVQAEDQLPEEAEAALKVTGLQ